MNLFDIGARVEREMRYSPGSLDWKVDLYGAIDSVYRQLLVSAAWPFLLRQQPLILIPDSPVVVGLSTTPTRTLSIIGGLTAGIGLPLEMQLTGPEGQTGATLYQLLLSQGCEVHLHPLTRATMLADANGNWAAAPFRIEGNQSFNVVTLEPIAGPFVSLPGAISAPPLDHGQALVVIKQPRVLLPADCAEVLRVFDDTGLPLRPLTREQWLRVGGANYPTAPLDGSAGADTGTPAWIMEDPGLEPRLPGARNNSEATRGLAVFETAFTAAGAGGGAWPAGTWEVAVSWYGFGRSGPISKPVTVTTALNDQLQLAALPVLDSDDHGRELWVWVRDASTPNRPFYYCRTRGDQTVTTMNINARFSGANVPESVIRYDDVAGPPSYLRLFPRSNRLRRAVVEYRVRPNHLSDPTDVPLLPEEHHELLVWLACGELVSRDDQTFKKNCEVQAARCFRALRTKFPAARYLPIQKGMLGGDVGALPFIDRDNVRNPT